MGRRDRPTYMLCTLSSWGDSDSYYRMRLGTMLKSLGPFCLVTTGWMLDWTLEEEEDLVALYVSASSFPSLQPPPRSQQRACSYFWSRGTIMSPGLSLLICLTPDLIHPSLLSLPSNQASCSLAASRDNNLTPSSVLPAPPNAPVRGP